MNDIEAGDGVTLAATLAGQGAILAMTVTAVRDFEDNARLDGQPAHLVVYTDDEGTRRALRRLACFSWENGYYHAGRLVAVDLFFAIDGSKADLRRLLHREAGIPTSPALA
jgi:hypothetical protein